MALKSVLSNVRKGNPLTTFTPDPGSAIAGAGTATAPPAPAPNDRCTMASLDAR